MRGGQLDGIQHSQHFVEIAAGAHRIDQHQLNLLVRADDEHGAHGGVVGGSAAFAGIARVARQHVVQFRHFQFRIADHRVVHRVALRLLNIGRPLGVVVHLIHAQADDLAVPLGELAGKACHVAELGGTNRREILGVREKDRPSVADPLMKADGSLGRLGGKVRCCIVDAK